MMPSNYNGLFLSSCSKPIIILLLPLILVKLHTVLSSYFNVSILAFVEHLKIINRQQLTQGRGVLVILILNKEANQMFNIFLDQSYFHERLHNAAASYN